MTTGQQTDGETVKLLKYEDEYIKDDKDQLPRSRLSQKLAYDTFAEHVYHEEQEKVRIGNITADTFLRKTLKFWVLPSNFIAVKRRIIRNGVPEWRYDGLASPSLEESGCYCNSIYIDTDDFAMYDKRVLQVDESMLFRYRWYSNKKCKMGFFEQKIRKPAWRGEASIKQRFQLDPRLLSDFLQFGSKVVPMKVPFIDQMYNDTKIWGGKLKHCLRTQYRRTVFQENNGADVRMSFDENISLYDIKKQTFDEIFDPSIYIPPHKMFHFPLGVLEVKLAFENFEQIDLLELPDWVFAMQNAGLIIQVDKFSKYCTGTAIMNLQSIHRVPSWIAGVKTLMEVELARRGREWYGAQKLPKWEIEENLTIPLRVEPREFMANERTLLKWVRMCYLALFVGFALLGFEYEPVTGIVLVVMSLIVLFRSYWVYRQRLVMLETRDFNVRFDDPWGPPLIVVMFVLPTFTYLSFLLGLWNVGKSSHHNEPLNPDQI